MPDQYYHTPLQHSRHIRVLHLAPAEDAAAPIRCQLGTISLDDHLEWDGDYTALSYSWDAQIPSCEIGCNGDSLLVTANCEAALRELRDPSETTRLWIDSICIDQSRDAVEERNIQVALMGEIYKCAKGVVVWLGKSDIRMRRALDLVMEIASVADDSTMENRRQKQRRLREKAEEISNKVQRDSEDPLGALFNRSWFHRMWTVQEVTLSWLDRITLRCGNIQVPWIQLAIAVDALKAAKYKWGRWKEAMSLQQQLAVYVLVRRYTGAKVLLDDNPGDLHNDPSAFTILVNARRKKSTDPRDKIFALCGLFKELEIPFPAPNYSRPVEDVYRDAVISCINYDKNLYILHHAPSDRRRSDLPSWVPDLAEDGWDEGDPRYGISRARFTASGRQSAKWSFSEDGLGLILEGKFVDRIIFRADPMPNLDSVADEIEYLVGSSSASGESSKYRDPDSDTLAEYLRLNHRGYSVLKSWVEISQWSKYPTGESTKEALRRTLGNDYPKNNELAAKEDSFDHWYNIMTLGELDTAARAMERVGSGRSVPSQPREREIYLREAMKRVPQEQLVAFALGAALGAAPGDAAFRFHSHIMAVSQKKCFFFTENCYFGTAADPLPVSIEPGDRIAIIRGLDMPLALRPVEGGYRFLTHVYVHGIMYGEAWPKNEDNLEEIILL
ncbi:uncharacterized protein PAC_17892 [Phialocephala subalpina]|uniref:Heterokaryon incompatibility domain-containing protein n=1 Tax=Phialocephala subalpina TaxID=576137 RepID=A0A1L7XSI0_9HELO|nr:uncharacterized protein PAC_17892 [Phialocephala subalpina]